MFDLQVINMRIALFSDTYPPEINGVAIHVKALKEGLESFKNEVLVVTTNADGKESREESILHCPSIKLKRIYGYGMSMPINVKQYNIIRNFNPDVIHIHTEFGIGLFGIFVAKMLKKPIVYTLHTIYDDYVYYVMPKPFVKTGQNVFYKYIRMISKNATVITGPSEKSHEYLKLAGIKRDIEVIPNPVDVNKFNSSNVTINEINEIRARYKIPKNAFVACVITRIGKEKSIDVLIDYIADYVKVNPNFKFLIVGDGPSKNELEKQAKARGLDDIVIFVGKVPNSELLPYYAVSDAFLTASLSDTNSISMLEAMSMGLPILQRSDPINEGQVIEGVNGFIFSDNQSFINKLDYLCNLNFNDRLELKKSVRRSVISSNTKNSTAQKLCNVYKKAMLLYNS